MDASSAPVTRGGRPRCPVCGAQVRYFYHEPGAHNPRRAGYFYTWCAGCWRYAISIGAPLSGRYRIDGVTDEVTRDIARIHAAGKEKYFLDWLDRYWNRGQLGQTFVPKPSRRGRGQ